MVADGFRRKVACRRSSNLKDLVEVGEDDDEQA
jgi:hypothetical protein